MRGLNRNNEKVVYKMAVITIILLSVASIVLYKQRMLFVDPSFITFGIINTKYFVFSEHRYGAFITQIYPLVGVFLGLSLKAILILYSFSFYIFYSITVYLVGVRWKQYNLGILLVFYFTLMVSDVFFWPNNEVHQGVTWMILFLGYYYHTHGLSKKIKIYQHLFMIILIALSTNSHLIVAIPFSFFWLFLFLDKNNLKSVFKNRSFLFYSGIIALLLVFRYYLSLNGWYDGQKLNGIKNLSISSIYQSFFSGHSHSIIKLFFSNYWLLIPIYLVGQYTMIIRKRYLQLLFVNISLLAYYSLICITYPDTFSRDLLFYIESEWMAFSMILATPFIYYFSLIINRRRHVIIIFSIIFLVRLSYIYNSYIFFNQRFEDLKSLVINVSKNEKRKVLIHRNKVSKDLFIMDWGLPIESIMYSKMEHIEPQVTIKFIDTNQTYLPLNDSFYSSFKKLPFSYLNNDYFRLDSTQNYQLMNFSDYSREKD